MFNDNLYNIGVRVKETTLLINKTTIVMDSEVFTISTTRMKDNYDIDCPETYELYYSYVEAIFVAEQLTERLSEAFDDVILVSVYDGNRQDEEGNVSGIPSLLYTFSTKDIQTTNIVCDDIEEEKNRYDGYVIDGKLQTFID